jgi:hypothetical protein
MRITVEFDCDATPSKFVPHREASIILHEVASAVRAVTTEVVSGAVRDAAGTRIGYWQIRYNPDKEK